MVHLDRRRQHLVIQGINKFHQTHRASGALGMPDLRLHRSESAPLPVWSSGLVEHAAQPIELDGVADPRAGSVRLHQFDTLRTVTRNGVGAAHGLRLSFSQGREQGLGPAIRR